jgi:glutamyl-tRNA synthetase
MHLGGLRTALYNYLFARSRNGTFILRIEDTDQTRLVPNAVEALTDMLQWVGINVDEGPRHGGSYGPYVQSQRLHIYSEQIQRLLENGTAYHCFCTTHRLDLLRKEALARGEIPKYDNRCRHLSTEDVNARLRAGTPSVIRFKLETFKVPWHDAVFGPITYDVAAIEGDPILMKSDGYPTYHFANVVDDHFMQITHVLRGIEWQVSTTKHILLYKAFDWHPPTFGHLPLLTNKEGKKLSKRQNDVHVQQYKNLGYLPEAVLNLLTNMGSGFTVRETAGMNLEELVTHFNLSKLNTNSTRVDFDRIKDFNRLHLQRHLKDSQKTSQLIKDVRQLVKRRFTERSCEVDDLTDERIGRVLDLSKERICLLTDLLQPEYEFAWLQPHVVGVCEVGEDQATACQMIQLTAEMLQAVDCSHFTKDVIASALQKIIDCGQWTYGRYMKLLRHALSGPVAGPAVIDILAILGRDATLRRLERALVIFSQKNSAKQL